MPIPEGCDPQSIVLSFPVAREQAGQRLDRFVQGRIPRLSRTRANAIVRACAYREDGTKRMPSDRVRYGETVFIIRPPFEEPIAPREFEVLYEDEDVLALDKPPGLPVHPSATYHKNTLSHLLRERYGAGPPQIAHRLDKETSGVVVCSKHPEAERRLKRAFEDRRTEKTYLAIARGHIEPQEGLIEIPIGRATEGLHLLMEPRPLADGGSPAVTAYRALARERGLSLVELRPVSGRQHQLRVHLAALSHPIVGDKLYGPEGVAPFFESIETGMTPALERRLGLARQALHAHRLVIPHPRTTEPLRLEAPMPADMASLWRAGLEDEEQLEERDLEDAS
jgi:23S rRNA pseudouridine1911/1915/1917 synthase